jgi:hypothetical protein
MTGLKIGRSCSRAALRLGAATALLLGIGSAACACDTPVYRYAMYRWEPAAYSVWCFHRGEPGKDVAEVHRRLDQLGGTVSPSTNLRFESVDLAAKDSLEKVPPWVKKAWEARAADPLPTYLVFTPWRTELLAGRLDAASVEAIAESPARKQIAQMLDKGHMAVFLLLPGKDPQQNGQAEKAVQEVIAKVRSGKVAMGPATVEEPAKQPADTSARQKTDGGAADKVPGTPAAPPPPELGLVKIERSDKAEAWLVRPLATVESELPEAVGQPMVFAAYGRGRVLPPCIGKGITPDNLLEQLAFLAGACSCIIKDQQPGVDLLFRWDWQATAERLAQGQEDSLGPGSARRKMDVDSVGEFPAEATKDKDTAGLGPGGDVGPPSGDARAKSAELGVTGSGGPKPEAKPIAALANSAPPAAAPDVSPEPSHPAEPSQPEYASRQMLRFGLGLLVAAAVVGLLGFLLLRRGSA